MLQTNPKDMLQRQFLCQLISSLLEGKKGDKSHDNCWFSAAVKGGHSLRWKLNSFFLQIVRTNFIVLSTNMAVLSRGWKPSIYILKLMGHVAGENCWQGATNLSRREPFCPFCIWFRNENSELTQCDGRGTKTENLSLCLKKNSAKLHPPLNRPFLKKDQSTAMLSEGKHKSGQMRPADPLPTLPENIRLRSI